MFVFFVVFDLTTGKILRTGTASPEDVAAQAGLYEAARVIAFDEAAHDLKIIIPE